MNSLNIFVAIFTMLITNDVRCQPPFVSTAENALRLLLINDQQKCLLKLVCVVGANITEFGTYPDSVASSFGYVYKPFDFSVVESPKLILELEAVARDSSQSLQARHHDDSIYIRSRKGGKHGAHVHNWLKVQRHNYTVSPVVKYVHSMPDNPHKYVKPISTIKEEKQLEPIIEEPSYVYQTVYKLVPAFHQVVNFGNEVLSSVVDVKPAPVSKKDQLLPVILEKDIDVESSEAEISTSLKHHSGSSESDESEEIVPANRWKKIKLHDVEDRSSIGYPAAYVFNRAMVVGLREGPDSCARVFKECDMNVDDIIRFGSIFFTSPNVD